jgi:hypothetical protein
MQMWKVNMEWSSNLGVRQRTNKLFPLKKTWYNMSQWDLDNYQALVEFFAPEVEEITKSLPQPVSNPSHPGSSLSLY